MAGYNVVIVGASELVGQELLKTLAQRRFPISGLKLLEGPANFSKGRKVLFANRELELQEISSRAFQDTDVVFFCGNPEIVQHFAPVASDTGALVIDLSGAFRGDDRTPAIIPEVNAKDLSNLKKKRIVVSPSPSVIQLVLPLNVLRSWTSLKRIIVHSFEPVSENGQIALELLSGEIKQVLEGKMVVPHLYHHQIAFNLLPETENFLDTGMSKSEARFIREVRRLWHLPELNVIATSIRVPLYIGMSQSVLVDFGRQIKPDEIREVFGTTPGVRLLDEPTVSLYPQPWQAINQDDILIGRIREVDPAHNTLAFWSSMDNLRRGATVNAVQIAESAIELKVI
ncbi:MAG: aspartate-semialdehyde dehydrogenase [Chloroflexota bacterium]|nr:aspartate-semialdehyde dehydrogenase [Chloroflexota bacterium]